MAEEQPDRLLHRLLRQRHRLRADLAYLVAGHPGADRRLCRFRPVRMAPRGRICHSRRRSGAAGPGAARGAGRRRWRTSRRSSGPRPSSPPSRRRTTPTVSAIMARRPQPCPARDDGPAPKHVVAGYGFWIFLLSDIIMFSALFATYAVLSGATDGGSTGAMLFSLPKVAGRDGLPAALELHLRPHDAGRPARECRAHPGLSGDHRAARARFPRHRAAGIRRVAARGRGARSLGVPLRFLRAGRLPWPACHRRAALARPR